MQKIISSEEKNKKIKKQQFVVGMLLIFLMLFSSIGFAFNNATQEVISDRVVYNGIEFRKDVDYWRFTFNGNEFVTRYNPQEIGTVSITTSQQLTNYANAPLYFSGEEGEHFIELERNLAGRFVLRTSRACVEGTLCTEDLPLKNCATDSIIVYKNANNNEEEKIYQQEGCTFIVAQTQNQAQYADAFLFKILGII